MASAASNLAASIASKTKTKKKHFVSQKVKLFRASDPLLSVLMWGVNHSVRLTFSYRFITAERIEGTCFASLAASWYLDNCSIDVILRLLTSEVLGAIHTNPCVLFCSWDTPHNFRSMFLTQMYHFRLIWFYQEWWDYHSPKTTCHQTVKSFT